MPRWLIWTLVAIVSWGVWAVMSKLIGSALSGMHSQALSTLGLLPVMAALAFSKNLTFTGNRSRGILCAVGAGVLACIGNVAYYDVFNRGAKAATVVPLTALYPLVTIGLAVLLLKERLNRIQVVGVLLSLPAIYFFNVQADAGLLSGSLGWVLVPIVLWGLAGLLQKVSTNHVSGELATLCFLGAFIPVAALILWREPMPGGVGPKTWLLVTALGLFFALGNFALLAAFASQGKASIITPITGLYPIVSVPIAILFLGERISMREMLAVIFALGSVVALSREGGSIQKEDHH